MSLWKKFTFHEVLFRGPWGAFTHGTLLGHSPSLLTQPTTFPPGLKHSFFPAPLHTHLYSSFCLIGWGHHPPAQGHPSSADLNPVRPRWLSPPSLHLWPPPSYFSLLLVRLPVACTCPLSTWYVHLFTALSLSFHFCHSWKHTSPLQSLPSLKNKLSKIWFLVHHLIEPVLDKVINSFLVVKFSGYFSIHFCHIWFSLTTSFLVTWRVSSCSAHPFDVGLS